MKKSILKNTVFNIVYRLLNVLFPMITAMYVARVLLPEGIGKVSYAQNILSYFTVIAALGIPPYGAREIARVTSDREQSDKLFSELFILNFASTVICSLIYIVLIFSIQSFFEQRMLFIAVSIPLFLNIFNVDWFYSGYEEYVYITIRSTIVKIISIVCIFLFVKDESSLVIYGLINGLAVSGNYVLNVINLRKRAKLKIKNLQFSRHLKPVFVLLFTTLATGLYNQIDVTMMGSLCSSEEIGYYTYAMKLVTYVTTISTAIAITTLPRLSQYFNERNMQAFKQLFSKTMGAVLTIVLPSMVGLLLLPDNIVSVVYGADFLPSAAIMRIATPIALIVAVSYLSGSVVLTAVNRERFLMLATMGGMIVNASMNALLIPKYGGSGAAFASVCGQLVVLVIHVIGAWKYIKLDMPKKDMCSLACALVIMAVIVTAIKQLAINEKIVLIASVAAGAASYFGVLLVFRNFTVELIARRLRLAKFIPWLS